VVPAEGSSVGPRHVRQAPSRDHRRAISMGRPCAPHVTGNLHRSPGLGGRGGVGEKVESERRLRISGRIEVVRPAACSVRRTSVPAPIETHLPETGRFAGWTAAGTHPVGSARSSARTRRAAPLRRGSGGPARRRRCRAGGVWDLRLVTALAVLRGPRPAGGRPPLCKGEAGTLSLDETVKFDLRAASPWRRSQPRSWHRTCDRRSESCSTRELAATSGRSREQERPSRSTARSRSRSRREEPRTMPARPARLRRK
jgi:hypothetical protein